MAGNTEIDEIIPVGDEAPADMHDVFGYTDQRGGLFGWDPDVPFPGYMLMSGAKPIQSKRAWDQAVKDARDNDSRGITRARNIGKETSKKAIPEASRRAAAEAAGG